MTTKQELLAAACTAEEVYSEQELEDHAQVLRSRVEAAVRRGDRTAAHRLADELRAGGMTYYQIFDFVRAVCPEAELAAWDALLEEGG